MGYGLLPIDEAMKTVESSMVFCFISWIITILTENEQFDYVFKSTFAICYFSGALNFDLLTLFPSFKVPKAGNIISAG